MTVSRRDFIKTNAALAAATAAGVNLPRTVRHEHRYLTHDQVEDLAATGYPSAASKFSSLDTRTNETYRLVVLFLAYTGVRFGEMAALRVGRLDLRRNRAVIAESVTPVQGQGLVWGTPKTHQRREVPIPRFLVAESWPATLPAGIPTIWSSPASATASRCESAPSARRSARPREPSASPTCTHTSSGTRQPASRSRAGPM